MKPLKEIYKAIIENLKDFKRMGACFLIYKVLQGVSCKAMF